MNAHVLTTMVHAMEERTKARHHIRFLELTGHPRRRTFAQRAAAGRAARRWHRLAVACANAYSL